jgi:hypothetical protein
MLLIISLFLYLLITVIAFLLFYRSGVKKWSALILGLILGFLFLVFFCPPQKMLSEYDGSFLPLLYILIVCITPFIILIYAFVMGVGDKCLDCINDKYIENKLL